MIRIQRLIRSACPYNDKCHRLNIFLLKWRDTSMTWFEIVELLCFFVKTSGTGASDHPRVHPHRFSIGGRQRHALLRSGGSVFATGKPTNSPRSTGFTHVRIATAIAPPSSSRFEWPAWDDEINVGGQEYICIESCALRGFFILWIYVFVQSERQEHISLAVIRTRTCNHSRAYIILTGSRSTHA